MITVSSVELGIEGYPNKVRVCRTDEAGNAKFLLSFKVVQPLSIGSVYEKEIELPPIENGDARRALQCVKDLKKTGVISLDFSVGIERLINDGI